jgi:hypothetical protein
MLTRDNKRLISRPFGICLYDAASGQSTLLAELKDSIGKVVSSNQVVYEDAFDGDGWIADLRYTWRKGSMEQDLIVRQLPRGFSPKNYGMDPATSRIEAWTEFFNPPAADIQTVTLSEEQNPVSRAMMAQPDFTDQRLGFGEMYIGQGQAFSISDDSALSPAAGVPVGKSFQIIDSRTLLIEAARYPDIKPLLDSLPETAAVIRDDKAHSRLANRSPAASREQLLAQFRAGEAHPKKSGEKILAARASGPRKPGIVWDYNILSSGTQNNYVFRSDQTFLISGTVTLNGTTTIEGGTVIKFSQGGTAKLSIAGYVYGYTTYYATIACTASAYKPAILTASDDDSVGDQINGSTGHPEGPPKNYYAGTAISWDNSYSTPAPLKYLRICFAATGINYFNGSTGHTLSHSQLINCQYPIKVYYNTVSLRNVLIHNQSAYLAGSYFVAGSPSSTLIGENLTIDQVTTLRTPSAAPPSGTLLLLTNTLLSGISDLAGYSVPTDPAVATFSVASSAFQAIVGAGVHYLASDTYRSAGVATITASLLADLRQKTTVAPLQLTENFTAPTILLPQAQRNTASIPCGFSYDPIDYIWTGLSLSSSLLLTGGVAIAIGGVTGTTLTQPATGQPTPAFISEGGPLNMNRLCRYQAVQELPMVWPAGGSGTTMSVLNVGSVLPALPDIRMRFTDVSLLADTTAKLTSFKARRRTL